MTRKIITRISMIFLVLLLATNFIPGCSSNDGNDITTPDPDEVPVPNPDGVLLDGDPDVNGLGAITTLPPSPVAAEDIDDHLLLTRLTAYINPSATVQEINDVLSAHGARIVAMKTDMPAVMLVIPRADNLADIQQLAETIQASNAFMMVFPAQEIQIIRPVDLEYEPIPPSSYGPNSMLPPFILRQQFTMLWGGLESARNINNPVTVLVPDVYYERVPSPSIPSQTFAGNGEVTTAQNGGDYIGNHGTHVCGTIGARPSMFVAGVHPDSSLVNIVSIPVGGLSWIDLDYLIVEMFPASGQFILSTSLGYNDPTFANYSKLQRATQAAIWRSLTTNSSHRFFHASSSGNDGTVDGDGGESRYNSPFCVSRLYIDLRSLAAEDNTATEAQQAAFASLMALLPGVDLQPDNVGVVGSSNSSGEKSSFSSRNADLRALGEDVLAPCTIADNTCDGTVARMSGTSMATPQVAGFAAFLMNLKPDLTAAQINDLVVSGYNIYNAGMLLSYSTALAVDSSINTAGFRKAVLDVTNSSGQENSPDGIFDEHDIELFLEKFSFYSGHDDADYSRYDLNGNHTTRSYDDFYFDLDINSPPSWEIVTQTIEGQEMEYDEDGLSDLDVLCYYSYSPLFQGDETIRLELLGEPCGLEKGIFVTERYLHSGALTYAYEGCSRPSYDSYLEDLAAPFDAEHFANLNSCSIGSGSANAQYSDMVTASGDTLTAIEGSSSAFSSALCVSEEETSVVRSIGMSYLEFEFEVVGRDAEVDVDITGDAFAIGPTGYAAFTVGFFGHTIDHDWNFEYVGGKSSENESIHEVIALPPGDYTIYFQCEASSQPTDEEIDLNISASASGTYRFVFSQEGPENFLK